MTTVNRYKFQMYKKFFLAFCLGIFLYFLCKANPVRSVKISQRFFHLDDNKQNLANVQNKIELPPNFQYPNGIARSSDGTLYIGSVVSGQILQIAPNGKITTFFPGSQEIFAATSLRLDEQHGILWGTSPDFLGIKNADGEIVRRPHRVFALDIRTGKVLRSLSMPDNGFGNDIALDSNGRNRDSRSLFPASFYFTKILI